MKDLCTHKRKLKGNERVNIIRNISALIQPIHVPEIAKIGQNVSSLTQTMPQSGKMQELYLFHVPLGIVNSNVCHNLIVDFTKFFAPFLIAFT